MRGLIDMERKGCKSSIHDHEINYRQTSNIRPLVGYEIFGHSNAVGASPVDTAPTTSSFST